MTRDTVTVKVPLTAEHLAILRTTVGGYAARDHFTLEQVDDLRMAVEEASVQLLRQAHGEHLTMELATTEGGLEVLLRARVADAGSVIDESSFSWTILRALTDGVRVEPLRDQVAVVLRKSRIVIPAQDSG